jgi:hypothetical protein
MTNQWFFYGCADNDSTPAYALYEHVSDCFFLIHHNRDLLYQLVPLFSSRYILNVCLLNSAANYRYDLLDNSVCKNWTIANKFQIPFAKFPRPGTLIETELLVPKSSSNPWNFENEQSYLMAACAWLQLLDIEQNKKRDGEDFYQSSYSVPGCPIPDMWSKVRCDLTKILYTEFDVDKAENKINQLFETHELNIR